MGYFEGLGDYNNTTGVGPTASNVVDGDSRRRIDGDLYEEQNGDTTLFWTGSVWSSRTGWSNSLLVGCDFSTTLGDSNVVLMGLNTNTTGGGVIATTASLALDTVLGLDVDAKFGGQNRLVYGNLYRQKAATTRFSPATGYRLMPNQDLFEAEANRFVEAEQHVFEQLKLACFEEIERVGVMIDNCLGALRHITLGNHTIDARQITVKTSAIAPQPREDLFGNAEDGNNRLEMSDQIVLLSPNTTIQGEVINIA